MHVEREWPLLQWLWPDPQLGESHSDNSSVNPRPLMPEL